MSAHVNAGGCEYVESTCLFVSFLAVDSAKCCSDPDPVCLCFCQCQSSGILLL